MFTDDNLKYSGVEIALPKKAPGAINLRFYSHLTGCVVRRFGPLTPSARERSAFAVRSQISSTARLAMPSGIASQTMKAVANAAPSPFAPHCWQCLSNNSPVRSCPSFPGNTCAVPKVTLHVYG